MKKLLACFLAVVLMLSCFTACNLTNKIRGIDCQEYKNCAVISFDDFPIKKPATFELTREGLGEGVIYYQVNLIKGSLGISYKDKSMSEHQSLGEFTADEEMPINGSGGRINGDKIEISFGALSPVSGQIIIAFTEDALIAVRKELKLHEHTFVYEMRDDAHRMIYTCDCDWLEERDFEHHYDEDNNGECDECEYFVGVSHEDHNWGYDVNETSHRQVFGCGCESPEAYEAHYNNNGDNLCDACGYELIIEHGTAGAFIDAFAGYGLGVDHCWSPDYSYPEAPKATSITFSKGLGFGVGYDHYSDPLPILNWGGN